MPVLAIFLSSLTTAVISFLVKFFTERVAIALASFVIWLGVLTAFAASVHFCLASLQSFVTTSTGGGGSSWIKYFWMGLGMFIPANASAVMSCVGSVWLGTEVYKIRKAGLQIFGK